jgi:hypothetical protein
MTALTELIAVLENEVRLGERLLQNLAAQKDAILAWDSSALLEHVEEKEHLVRKLAEMEGQRQEAIRRLLTAHGLPGEDGAPALKSLLAQLPPTPYKAMLDLLQQRSWRIYSRLRVAERQLSGLMGALLNHIGEALGLLTTPSQIPLYAGNGALAASRPDPGFVQEKV